MMGPKPMFRSMPKAPSAASSSLRTQIRRVAAFLASLALLGCIALLITAYIHRQSMKEVVTAFKGGRNAYELEEALSQIHRALATNTSQGPSNEQLLPLLENFQDKLKQARVQVHSAVEAQVLDEIDKDFQEVRQRLLQEDLSARRRFKAWKQLSGRVQPQLAFLISTYRELVGSALARANFMNRFVSLLSISIVLLLAAAMVRTTRKAKTLVIDPLNRLGKELQDLRLGKAGPHAPEDGPEELARLNYEFNALTQELARQRDAQMSFIASVVHDFRNPLTALSASSALLLRNPAVSENPSLCRGIQMSARQVERLTRIADDLLDATRIEGGRIELRPKSCDLRQVAKDSVELYEYASPSHKIELSLPKEALCVHGDSTRLEQVLNNLLSNAIKYSPQGGRVDVRVFQHEGFAFLEVRDQGIGIGEDEREQIFRPFQRGRGSREAIPGVGLGLSVVRRIVEAHQGQIEVQSQPGLGSTFRVKLPMEN